MSIRTSFQNSKFVFLKKIVLVEVYGLLGKGEGK
jgi:hypothetical protein